MKRLLTFFLSLIVMAGIASRMILIVNGGASPSELEVVISINDLKIGDYFTLGKYNDEPIIWRYIADDGQGKLIVSDKILCFKPFSAPLLRIDNFWEESLLRKWLNSTESEGEVVWGDFSYDSWLIGNVKANEKGFLHESNFSQRERNVMKTITQWTMLPNAHLDLTTNGNNEAYNALKEYRPGSPRDGGYFSFYDISELPDAYFGAAYEITDTVFLLDEMQIYHMWENFGDIRALCADSCKNRPIRYGNDKDSEHYGFFLRTPQSSGNCSAIVSDGRYLSGHSFSAEGIRPAFYLDTDNAVILSGSGTEDDSYVISGKMDDNSGNNNTENNNEDGKKKDGISVYLNGSEIYFDQLPIIENDRTLVPFRAIFEALGAEVGWDEATLTATGKLNETTIQLTIGSETAYVNAQPIPLDVPPKIMNSRTLVPLRFIAENFGFNVDWDGDEQRVDIKDTRGRFICVDK